MKSNFYLPNAICAISANRSIVSFFIIKSTVTEWQNSPIFCVIDVYQSTFWSLNRAGKILRREIFITQKFSGIRRVNNRKNHINCLLFSCKRDSSKQEAMLKKHRKYSQTISFRQFIQTWLKCGTFDQSLSRQNNGLDFILNDRLSIAAKLSSGNGSIFGTSPCWNSASLSKKLENSWNK